MSESRKFRKKPAEVEAMQLALSNVGDVRTWLTEEGIPHHLSYVMDGNGRYLAAEININESEVPIKVFPGAWLIKGVQGEFYPCNPDVFEQTYEAVPEGEL